MFLLSMFRKAQPQPAMQYSSGGAASGHFEHQTNGSVASMATQAGNIPSDFPVDAFLRSAKISFVRLQAANDKKDLDDIREYTTPEMFAEIAMQIRERDDTPQSTNVLTITADLLEVHNEDGYAIASVRMRGELSENKGAPEGFDEVWHVQKNLRDDQAVWLLAGIQQVE